MCLWINIAHTPRWAAVFVPTGWPTSEHAKVDFNCNAIIMSHGFPSFLPFSPTQCLFHFPPEAEFSFFFCLVFPPVCLPLLTWAAAAHSQLVSRLACVTLLLAYHCQRSRTSREAGKNCCSWRSLAISTMA